MKLSDEDIINKQPRFVREHLKCKEYHQKLEFQEINNSLLLKKRQLYYGHDDEEIIFQIEQFINNKNYRMCKTKFTFDLENENQDSMKFTLKNYLHQNQLIFHDQDENTVTFEVNVDGLKEEIVCSLIRSVDLDNKEFEQIPEITSDDVFDEEQFKNNIHNNVNTLEIDPVVYVINVEPEEKEIEKKLYKDFIELQMHIKHLKSLQDKEHVQFESLSLKDCADFLEKQNISQVDDTFEPIPKSIFINNEIIDYFQIVDWRNVQNFIAMENNKLAHLKDIKLFGFIHPNILTQKSNLRVFNDKNFTFFPNDIIKQNHTSQRKSTYNTTIEGAVSVAENFNWKNFISALYMICELPELIKTMFDDNCSNVHGIQRLKLYKNGRMHEVTIDNLIPCSYYGEPLFINTDYIQFISDQTGQDPTEINSKFELDGFVNQEIWPKLIQKAYAKLHGTQQQIESIPLNTILEDLTGFPVQIINLKKTTIDELYSILKDIRANKYIASVRNRQSNTLKQPFEKGFCYNIITSRRFKMNNERIDSVKSHNDREDSVNSIRKVGQDDYVLDHSMENAAHPNEEVKSMESINDSRSIEHNSMEQVEEGSDNEGEMKNKMEEMPQSQVNKNMNLINFMKNKIEKRVVNVESVYSQEIDESEMIYIAKIRENIQLDKMEVLKQNNDQKMEDMLETKEYRMSNPSQLDPVLIENDKLTQHQYEQLGLHKRKEHTNNRKDAEAIGMDQKELEHDCCCLMQLKDMIDIFDELIILKCREQENISFKGQFHQFEEKVNSNYDFKNSKVFLDDHQIKRCVCSSFYNLAVDRKSSIRIEIVQNDPSQQFNSIISPINDMGILLLQIQGSDAIFLDQIENDQIHDYTNDGKKQKVYPNPKVSIEKEFEVGTQLIVPISSGLIQNQYSKNSKGFRSKSDSASWNDLDNVHSKWVQDNIKQTETVLNQHDIDKERNTHQILSQLKNNEHNMQLKTISYFIFDFYDKWNRGMISKEDLMHYLAIVSDQDIRKTGVLKKLDKFIDSEIILKYSFSSNSIWGTENYFTHTDKINNGQCGYMDTYYKDRQVIKEFQTDMDDSKLKVGLTRQEFDKQIYDMYSSNFESMVNGLKTWFNNKDMIVDSQKFYFSMSIMQEAEISDTNNFQVAEQPLEIWRAQQFKSLIMQRQGDKKDKMPDGILMRYWESVTDVTSYYIKNNSGQDQFLEMNLESTDLVVNNQGNIHPKLLIKNNEETWISWYGKGKQKIVYEGFLKSQLDGQ